MKELSVEEKAQRFDEAIEKFYAALRSNSVNKSGTELVSDVRKILSELTESEDERVRKGIIGCIKCNMPDDDRRKKYITWLKEHGEPTEINSEEFASRLGSLLKQFESLPTKELTSSLTFYRNIIQKDGIYKAEPMRVKFNPGERKLMCVKLLKENLNISLKEARDCAEDHEFECTREQYHAIKAALISEGAHDFYIKD